MKMFIIHLIYFFLTVSIATSDLKKSVLFLVVDDLRPALGCYKDKNSFTPNIDLLAKESFQFNQAYAQQALCAPSRNSFLTSRRPDSLYLYDFYSYWRFAAGNFTTLPQHFKQNGYTTASFGKIFHPGVSSNWSDDFPYSWSNPPYHPPSEKYKNSRVCMDSTGKAHKNLICPVEVNLQPGRTLPDIEIMEEVKKFVTEYDSEKPFFVAVGFHKPHIPFKFPISFLDLHPLEFISKPIPQERPPTMPVVAWNPWTDLRAREDVEALNLKFPYEPIPDNFTQLIRQGYYASVTYIDDLIGQILKTLEQEKKKNNTIIILTGDHGWSLGEHQEWAKYSNFEVAVRVPLIIYDPHLKHYKNVEPKHENSAHSTSEYFTSDNLVELVDLFPTLCELTNIPVPPPCSPIPSPQMLCTEGESLVPIMYNKKQVQGKLGVFSQYPRPSKNPTHKSDEPKLRDINVMGYSLRTKRHRYTEWVKFQDLTPKWKQIIATELYDHHIDPNESINLFGRPGFEEIQKELSSQLRAGWRSAHSIQYDI